MQPLRMGSNRHQYEQMGCARWQVHNPSTGEVIAKVPQMRANETKAAIAAASAAWPAWCKKTAKERGAVMRKCGTHTTPACSCTIPCMT